MEIELIDKSIQDILLINERTKIASPLTHNYIGVIARTILSLLCSYANSHDKGCRHVLYEDNVDRKNLINVIHRTFFTMLHALIEDGINYIIVEKNFEPGCSVGAEKLRIIDKLKKENQHIPCVKFSELRKIEKYFKKTPPDFNDRIRCVINHANISGDRKNLWINYFKALTIIRNMCAHSTRSLTKQNIMDINKTCFKKLVTNKRLSNISTTMYSEIIGHVLDFYDECGYSLYV